MAQQPQLVLLQVSIRVDHLIRRSMPQLIAYGFSGVRTTGPTGLIFAMRSRYGTNRTAGTEAFFNEADSKFASENSNGNGI